MTKEHTHIAMASSTRCEEVINEAIYAKWTRMTRQFADEYESEPLSAQEYCRYIQDIL
ncbi:MAG: hypothetical protein KAH86_00865 [Methanosarcinales archaeon]|nr:hypothetical protein [Methanosarcinales archaeon]